MWNNLQLRIKLHSTLKTENYLRFKCFISTARVVTDGLLLDERDCLFVACRCCHAHYFKIK